MENGSAGAKERSFYSTSDGGNQDKDDGITSIIH